MNNHRLKSESETVKQTDYMKKQQQLRAMNKPFVPNKSMNADAMIENLLSNKETFQKKKDNSIKAPQPPSWLLPDHSSVSPFYSQLWHLVRMSTGQLADTASVSSLLMTSGLSTDTLGFIWSLANRTVPGSLTQAELYAVLALVALAQGGYIFNDASILNQIPQPPIPKLDLTILPQYNMNFTTHSSGHSTHYLQQNPAAIDSTLSLDNSTSKEPTPVSIVSLDVNKLQGAPVLTLPNYNFGMPYQGFDVMGAGAVITNKNNTSVQSVPVYQEPSSAIPSISLGLSTPTKVNNYQPLNEKNSDCDSTSKEANNDVVSFNNINKFKLDSPTKLPNLSQPSDVARKFSNLSLQDSKKGEEVENQAGQTSVDDSFDSLSTERATNRAAAPNYNLDLFELTAEVQHVFPNCETSVKDTDSNRGENLVPEKTLIDGDFDDDFTDFQSADFTSFNAPPREASIDALKSTPATSIDALKSTSSFDVLKDVQLSTDIFNSTSETSIHVLKSTPSIDVLKNVQLSTNIFKPTVETSLKSTPETSIDVLKSIPVINFSIDVPKSTPAVELAPKFEPEDDDDFSNFQEAPIPIEDDLFPKTITINEIGCKNVDNSLYDKSEPNYSEWSDTTSNDWSGGNKSDEKDTDSLNYVDLSDIKLEIPTSDTEDAIKIDAVTLDVIKSEAVTLGVMKSDAVTLDVKEDKYSALRGLQPSQDVATNDDFGDFLAAEPGECQMSNDMDVNNSSVQIRCLEACLQILQESYSILSSASTPKVLSEVISDPRTINHLTCLLEVFRVSERLIKHVENNDIVSQIQSTWNDILPLLEGSRCYQLEDTTGPVCELCRCNSGPFPMKYGRSTFHAPCANLYLHYVDSTLPNSEAF